MKKTTKKLLFISAGIIFLMTLFSCRTSGPWEVGVGGGGSAPPPSPEDIQAPQGKGPPDHAPAHGYRAKYKYKYWSDQRVYQDVDRDLYFYWHDGQWRAAAKLPYNIRVRLGNDYVIVESLSDKPYESYGKKKIPPGQEKKNRGGKGKKDK